MIKTLNLPAFSKSPWRFVTYAALVAVLNWLVLHFILPPESAGEVRDSRFYLLLPFTLELAFLLACLPSIVWANTPKATKAPSTRYQLSMAVLNQVPIVLGCLAVIPAESIHYGSLLIIGLAVVTQLSWDKLPRRTYVTVLQWLIGCIVIAITVKGLVLNSPKDDYHWSWYVAPLSSIREGGIFLWDTPSQYGFLNLLFASSVASLFNVPPVEAFAWVLTAYTIATIVLVLFVLYKNVSFSPLVSAVFACCVVCAYPGWVNELTGPVKYPSSSGFRFLPALLTILCVWRATETRSTLLVIVSGIIGATACLWSGESLMYTLPPLMCFVAAKAFLERDILFVMAPPFLSLLLIAIFSAILLYGYSVYMGVAVEPQSLFEYALIYAKAGVKQPQLIDFNHWTSFFISAAALSYFFARCAFTRAEGGTASGALFFGYLFCVASYYISRSHENAVRNLMPWLIISLGLTAGTLSSQTARSLARTATFTMCLLLVNYLGSPSLSKARVDFTKRLSKETALTLPSLVQVPPELQQYISNKWPGYPVTVVDHFYASAPLTIPGTTGYNLGITPLIHFRELHSNQRERTYLSRMFEKKPRSLLIAPYTKTATITASFANWSTLCSLTELEEKFEWKIYEVKRL